MATLTQPKDERINIRLEAAAKATLERAAQLEARSVNSFIVASALQVAQKTIHDHEVMELTESDARSFLDALDNVTANDRLKAAMAEHKRRVTSR